MSQTPGQNVPDPYGGRTPTSHERAAGQAWDASYRGGPAPWDVGHPQQAVLRVAAAGGFSGRVLDAGCGTGENALHLAATGLSVLGVDVAGIAVDAARAKASARGLNADFEVADALELRSLGRRFNTILDCGLFHSFDADERQRYLAGLASVAERGATLYVLCFSDQGSDLGPHPVSEADLRQVFEPSRWRLLAVDQDRVETRFHDHGAPAWLVTARRD